MNGKIIFRALFAAYFMFLSWQLLTPVTIVNPGSWDKLVHFAGFFMLGTLAALGWSRTQPLSLIALLVAYGVLTETAQHFIPGRSYATLDWIADALGVLVAVTIVKYL